MVKLPFEKKQSIPQEDILKLIDKGAPTKEDVKHDNSKKIFSIHLRIPASMIPEIDNALKKTVGIKRNGWIVQAIQKELDRIKNQSKN